jgi:uncharacterized protein (DUF58 family)
MNEVSEIRSLEKLDLLAKKVVEGYLLGLHRSPFHGFSAEFREHKQYNDGDNLRNIDYKVYARTDKLFVKKYDEETNLKCQFVLDVSGSMHFPYQVKRNKLDFSVVAIASLMNLLKRQRDAYGLTVFSDTILQTIEAKLTEKNKQQIYSTLWQYLNTTDTTGSSNIIYCLEQLAFTLPKRSLVVIFSDFLDGFLDNEGFENKFVQVMQHLIFQKHEIVIFHVSQSKTELQLDYDNIPLEFVDMESNEKIKLIPNEIKAQYQKFMSRKVNFLSQKCIQFGVDIVEVDIDDNYELILNAFLRKRKKMK